MGRPRTLYINAQFPLLKTKSTLPPVLMPQSVREAHSPGPDPSFLPSSRVMTYREHTAWVVKAYLQKHPEGHIMSVR